MATKFYAVRVGRTPGIYRTWADCQAQTTGFSGAVFKSFPTMAEAEAFMAGTAGGVKARATGSHSTARTSAGRTAGRAIGRAMGTTRSGAGKQTSAGSMMDSDCDIIAYIDGSFDKTTGAVGAGGVYFVDGTKHSFSLGTKEPMYAQFWNVSGELLAAMHVVQLAIDEGRASVALYYDYMGIEHWATGSWKRNNELTKRYHAFMQRAMETVTVEFHKVAAHTGVQYNEEADQLAKAGTRKA